LPTPNEIDRGRKEPKGGRPREDSQEKNSAVKKRWGKALTCRGGANGSTASQWEKFFVRRGQEISQTVGVQIWTEKFPWEGSKRPKKKKAAPVGGERENKKGSLERPPQEGEKNKGGVAGRKTTTAQPPEKRAS